MNIQQQDAYLQQNYNLLKQERNHIQNLKKEFVTLNSATENSELVVTSNYYNYIVLLFVSILLIFLLIKYSYTGQQSGGGNNFTNDAFFIVSLILIGMSITKFLNNYDGYIFISVIIIVYIIIKLKLSQ
jgi:hypothetical protein